MYQEMSNTMLALSSCEKISDVPFPFGYAQMLAVSVYMFAIILPIYVACFTDSLYLGPAMTFVVFESMWCVNEVARELENPFGEDITDISLHDFHSRFMQILREVDVNVFNQIEASSNEQCVAAAASASVPAGQESAKFSHTGQNAQKMQSDSGVAEGSLDKEAGAEMSRHVPYSDCDLPAVNARIAQIGLRLEDTMAQILKELGADQHLAQIGARMERNMANIATELGGLSACARSAQLAKVTTTPSPKASLRPPTSRPLVSPRRPVAKWLSTDTGGGGSNSGTSRTEGFVI